MGSLSALTVNAATTDWWDTAYGLRQNISVNTGANNPDKGYQDYTLRFTGFDTAALIGAGEMQADCDDLRVLYYDGSAWTELERHVINCNSANSDVRFASPINLTASASDTDFYIYYSNPTSGTPTALSTTNVYLWYDDASANNLAAYDTGRGDPWHGNGWDNSLAWNAAGYYTYSTGDNFTSTYRRPVDERDVYVEAEFFHTACFRLNMSSGVILRGISTGSGGGESSNHYYATNRGHQNGGGCNTGGYSNDGDIVEDARTVTAVNGANPAAVVRNQWRRQGLAAWAINGTNLEFWDEDDSANWSALGYPDAGNSHVAGADNNNENVQRGYAGFLVAQDAGRIRNVLIRRYTSPEPVLALGAQEALPGPQFVFTKSVATQSDPYNLTVNPKAIPGAMLDYNLLVQNTNTVGTSDTDTVVIIDSLPANMGLFVDDLVGPGQGPVEFVDGVGASTSGLTYSYASLGSGLDDIDFSTDGVDFTYVPVADAEGVDDNVTHIRITPKGVFNAATAGGPAECSFRFRLRVD